MLNLVAPGPKLIVAKTENQQALKQYLQEQFQAIEMNQLGLGEKDYNIKCIVCVADTVQPATGILYLGMTQTVEYVLCHLMHEQAKTLIREKLNLDEFKALMDSSYECSGSR